MNRILVIILTFFHHIFVLAYFNFISECFINIVKNFLIWFISCFLITITFYSIFIAFIFLLPPSTSSLSKLSQNFLYYLFIYFKKWTNNLHSFVNKYLLQFLDLCKSFLHNSMLIILKLRWPNELKSYFLCDNFSVHLCTCIKLGDTNSFKIV